MTGFEFPIRIDYIDPILCFPWSGLALFTDFISRCGDKFCHTSCSPHIHAWFRPWSLYQRLWFRKTSSTLHLKVDPLLFSVTRETRLSKTNKRSNQPSNKIVKKSHRRETLKSLIPPLICCMVESNFKQSNRYTPYFSCLSVRQGTAHLVITWVRFAHYKFTTCCFW